MNIIKGKGPSITFNKGIVVKEGDAKVVLDPSRRTEDSVVTHAHMDHLVKGSLMTPQTRDIMEVRLNSSDAETVEYHENITYGGFGLVMREAGHCLGSAMVHLTGPGTDVLYTGDINPDGGLTIPPPKPQSCRTMIVEATYGQHTLPPKDQVTEDIIAWSKSEIERSTIIFGAYEFGKAQEVIAAVQDLGHPIYSTEKVKRICDVYTRHGVDLKCKALGDGMPEERSFIILPGHQLKPPKDDLVRSLRREGARVAYVSGWCGVYDFTRSRGIDAQFPLSDHGDLPSLLSFIDACGPEEVLTVYGSPGALSAAVKEELGLGSRPLKEKTRSK